MDKTDYSKIIDELETKLDELKEERYNIFTQADKSIGLCKLTYLDLQKHVLREGFKSEEDEIYFFKFIKPRVCSKITFYRKVAVIESHRPRSTIPFQIEYLKKEILKLQIYFEEHGSFLEYYRSGRRAFDDKYFKRNITELNLGSHYFDYLVNTQFSTVYDGTLADILAYENLEKYLNNEILKLERVNDDFEINEPKNEWTGKLTYLAELAYGIKETGVVNNGNISVKEIIELFGKIFRLPPGNVYNSYRSVYSRKTQSLIFIEKMREALLKKINDKYK